VFLHQRTHLRTHSLQVVHICVYVYMCVYACIYIWMRMCVYDIAWHVEALLLGFSIHLVQILRGGSSSSGFLIREHSPGEEDPPRSAWCKFFEGGPFPPGSGSGNIVDSTARRNAYCKYISCVFDVCLLCMLTSCLLRIKKKTCEF